MLHYASLRTRRNTLACRQQFPSAKAFIQSRVIEHARKAMGNDARDTTVQYFRWGPLDPHMRVRVQNPRKISWRADTGATAVAALANSFRKSFTCCW
eukprot:11185473-Lingulodinium_polyedra.AAC.1